MIALTHSNISIMQLTIWSPEIFWLDKCEKREKITSLSASIYVTFSGAGKTRPPAWEIWLTARTTRLPDRGLHWVNSTWHSLARPLPCIYSNVWGESTILSCPDPRLGAKTPPFQPSSWAPWISPTPSILRAILWTSGSSQLAAVGGKDTRQINRLPPPLSILHEPSISHYIYIYIYIVVLQ